MHKAATLNKLGGKTHHKNEKVKKIFTLLFVYFLFLSTLLSAETVDFSALLCLRLKKKLFDVLQQASAFWVFSFSKCKMLN